MYNHAYLLQQLRAEGHDEVRTSHGYVFQHLIEGSPTIGALAEALGITQQGASKAVRELEAMGYVERVPDDSDGRIRRIVMTPRGADLVERARTLRRDLEAELERAVGRRNLLAARRVLNTLIERVGAADAIAKRRVRPPT